MSRVESPFHAIAAQALDDPPVELNVTTTIVASTLAVTANGNPLSRQESPKGADSRSEEMGKNCAMEEEADNAGRQPEQNASMGTSPGGAGDYSFGDIVVKKSKKRTNVWTKSTSRKSAKKSSVKNSGVRRVSDAKDDTVILKPFNQEDSPKYPILLSKVNKAEKIELSADRLAASGSKGYRMVRATRGVVEGAWYFEIYVERLGRSGHARLGWSTRKGDIQAPVGYDAHSYSFRDVDGSKVHAALREGYGDTYHENDVIGFYINLPRDESFNRKAEEEVVGYKGRAYILVADEPLKPVPGSEILFFKNGKSQGVAFRNINDGVYFPAASMYTLPSDESCKVVFNFGPDFKYPVSDIGDRPLPCPMCQASGPREPEADEDATISIEMVADSVDGRSKEQVAPVSASTYQVDVAPAPLEEVAPRPIGNAPVVKKKAKVSKLPVTGDLPPFVPKKPKGGDSRPNPDLKNDIIHTVPKSGPGALKSVTVPVQKRSKKEVSGTEVPRMKAMQNGNKKDAKVNVPVSNPLGPGSGLPTLKKKKKVPQGTGLPSKKDTLGPGLPNTNGAELVNVKGKKAESSKALGKSVGGGKEGLTNAGLRNFQGTKRPSTVIGFHDTKANKKGTGAGVLKRTVKDFQSPPANRGDYLASTSAVLRPNQKGLRPAGSFVTSERGLMGTRFPPAFRGWRDGVHALDVAVDVLETPNRSE